MKGKDIITHAVRGEMPDTEQMRQSCIIKATMLKQQQHVRRAGWVSAPTVMLLVTVIFCAAVSGYLLIRYEDNETTAGDNYSESAVFCNSDPPELSVFADEYFYCGIPQVSISSVNPSLWLCEVPRCRCHTMAYERQYLCNCGARFDWKNCGENFDVCDDCCLCVKGLCFMSRAPVSVDLSSPHTFLDSIVFYKVDSRRSVGTFNRVTADCEFIDDFTEFFFAVKSTPDTQTELPLLFVDRKYVVVYGIGGTTVNFWLGTCSEDDNCYLRVSGEDNGDMTLRLTREQYEWLFAWIELVMENTDRYCSTGGCETILTNETSCLQGRGGWDCRSCCSCEICATPVDISSHSAFMATAHSYNAVWYYPYDIGNSRTNDEGWGYVYSTTDTEYLETFADFFFSFTDTVRSPARTPSRNCSYGTFQLEIKSSSRSGLTMVEVFVENGVPYLWFQGYSANILTHRTHTYDWDDPYYLIRERLSSTYRITMEQYEWFKDWVMPIVELDRDMDSRVR
jgi:hypothetical protein